MAGRKEEAYFPEAERLYIKENLTIKQIIASGIPVCENTLYDWKKKGGWEEKRRAHLASPRDLAALMRASLDIYLKTLEEQAQKGVLDHATFDGISKAVAAIKAVERQGADIRMMSVEVMRHYTDFLNAQEIPAGELQLHGERIRAYFQSLE